MAKLYAIIGYAFSNETSPGVWEDSIEEYAYYGDTVRNNRRLDNSENLNDNININNLFSIIADPFANQNFHNMKYIRYMGSVWKITNIDVQRPRLVLTVGGVYNGITS